MENEESHGLNFFTNLLPGFTTKIVIPEALTVHISNNKSRERATLVSHNGKIWHVKVSSILNRDSSSMYMGGDQGWHEFVSANGLAIGDMVLFKYKGNMVFSFRVFDNNTCCEKKTKRKRIVDDHNIDNECQIIDSKRERAASYSKKGRQRVDRNCTNNAHFVTTIKNNYLYIPAEFEKRSGLSSDHHEVVINTYVDGQRRKWQVGLCHSGRDLRVTKGWLQFVKNNRLKFGDRVRFELVPKQENSKVMHLDMQKFSN